MSAEHSELLFRSRSLPLCHRRFFQAKRKGTVIVMVAILMVVLIGCAALAVDVGYLYVARTELQRAADAGALAGAQGLRRTDLTPTGEYLYPYEVYELAESYTGKNICARKNAVLNRDTDIKIGYCGGPANLIAPI